MLNDQPVWIRQLTAAEIEQWAQRSPGGVLAGTRFALKDNIDLAGVPTTAGCPALTDVAMTSAYAVERLLDAGALPVGKTNMDQFATGLVGTRSPYGACHSIASPLHVSGGSSSGSAVAVASGLVPLALGTDTAGSGRVPAAFNGIVGLKPTRGLVSKRGVIPACRSLDCVSTFTRTVGGAREAFEVLADYDGADPWSRRMPVQPPVRAAREFRVIGVPDRPLALDREHLAAWELALKHAETVAAHVVPVDVSPFVETSGLLYEGPWPAERWAGFGHWLEHDGPHLDPVVRAIAMRGRDVTGADVFRGLDRLAQLRRAGEPVWDDVDALLLPTTPRHPTLAEVAADPVGANAAIGTFTNFMNLLDLCGIAVPAGDRADGLPFGVQLIAPAFGDRQLLALAERWAGEAPVEAAPAAGSIAVAVAGAHLSGMALNRQLVDLGGRLGYRARTAAGYQLFRLPGTGVARPGLVRTGAGPVDGIALEVWELTPEAVGALLTTIPAPLGLGRLTLDDGRSVTGFVAESAGITGAEDISRYGGWRAYCAANH
jgi:allophanate hydrolase